VNIKQVCILGGTGFVGRHIAYRLAEQGYDCRVFTRHAHRHRELATSTGCRVEEVDIFDVRALADALTGCDAVIHLVGILNESRRQTFRRIHVDLVDTVVKACHQARVRRLLHMSALNADAAAGTSQYLRTKGEGENLAHTRGQPDIAVTSFRPSVVFGRDDSFINRFASLLRLPGPMPLACPQARFAPVYVGDVARAFVDNLANRDTFGRRYELCGPQAYTLEALVRYIAKQLGLRKVIVPMGDAASRLQAQILERVPGKPFTTDNYLSMRLDSVCREDGLGKLGIAATHLDAIVPEFLGQQTPRGRLNDLRRPRG
jgi:NADH dehydrogenase